MNNFLEKLQIKLTPRFIRRIKRIEDELNNLNAKNSYTDSNINNKLLSIDSKLNNIININKSENNYFTDHYEYWTSKRIVAIVEHYGENFFKGKKILELGCGYGNIGKVLISIGAEVIFCEGREEHINILRKRFPNNRIYKMNLENEWFFDAERFDLILHLGVLYHLDNFEYSLKKSFLSSDNIVLETEVSDSDDPKLVLKVYENQQDYDQSLIGKGSRPSPAYLENIFRENNFKYQKVTDSRCNSSFHRYDWEIKNTNTFENGLRRFYFLKNRAEQSRAEQSRAEQL